MIFEWTVQSLSNVQYLAKKVQLGAQEENSGRGDWRPTTRTDTISTVSTTRTATATTILVATASRGRRFFDRSPLADKREQTLEGKA